MKKIFKLGLTALSAVFAVSLMGCKDETLDKVVDYSDYEDIDMEAAAASGSTLSSISLDTSNAKTNYYVGEDFTVDGLVVKANYVEYVDGKPQSSTKEVKSYFYDTDDLDMSKAGTYPVEFTYREADVIKTAILNVKVTPSYLADLGVEYLAGLEPTQTIIEVAKNSTFDAKSAVTFKKKYMKGTEEGVVEGKVEDMSSDDISALVVDQSQLNLAKAGKYIVKYTFSASVTRSDNSVYNYDLSSFVVVIVK